MTLHTHIQPYAGNPDVDVLKTLVDPTVQITYGADQPDPAIYHVLSDPFPNQERLTASPNLHAVIIPFAGVPAVTQEIMRAFPHVTIHNLPFNYAPTAETALALMMACAKFVVSTDQKMRRHDWSPRYSDQPQIVLRDKTVLLLGYGRIGSYMAPVLTALGMNVLALRRSAPAAGVRDDYAHIFPTSALHTLLPQADIVVSTLPDTPQTVGLIDAPEFALLPDGAILVNVGRSAIIDETALYENLRSGKLAGAGIDVWYNSPRGMAARTNTPPSRYPFHELDNVVMSPHRSGWLGKEDGGRTTMLAAMLNAAAAGQPVPHQIDLALGY